MVDVCNKLLLDYDLFARGLVVLAEQDAEVLRGELVDGAGPDRVPPDLRERRAEGLHRHAERRELRVHAQMDAPRRVLRA